MVNLRSLKPATLRDAVLVLLPLVATGISTYLVYRQPAEVTVDFERHFEDGFVSGFHNHETMDGRGFRWTAGEASVTVDNLPRQSRLRVEVRIKGYRPPGIDLPQVRFTANGATVFETLCDPGLVTYRFGVTLPGNTLELGIHSGVFVPGDFGRDDDRVLGIQVFSVHIEPQGGELATGRLVTWMVVAAAAFLGTCLVAGVRLSLSSLAATGCSLAFTTLLGLSSVRFLPYPQETVLLAVSAMAVSFVLRLALGRVGWLHPAERPALIGVLVASFVLKAGVLFFPFFVSSDADFHANRLRGVMEGVVFPTSVTQHEPPFQIPYPVSMHAVAAPAVAVGMDRVTAVKSTALIADIAIGLILAFVARRFLNDFRIGIVGAALYQLVPLNLLTFSAGNYSNLFGAAMTVGFLGLFLGVSVGAKTSAVVGALVFSVLALTSHFGSFLFGLVLWPSVLGAVVWIAAPGLSGRRPGLLAGVVFGGLLLAFLYYVVGYWDLFAGQWERVLTRDYAVGSQVVEGPLAKLQFNIPFYQQQLGVVFAILALLGALPILRRPSASPFHATALVWLGAAMLFFVLDLTTALEVRYVLQVLPLLALFAANYLTGAMDRGRLGKAAAVVIFAYLLYVGLTTAQACLLTRYH